MIELLPELTFDIILLRSEALAAGYTDRDLAKLVTRGELVKVRRGAYVDGALWSSLPSEQRHQLLTRAVLKQANVDAVVSHGSAVVEHGGPLWGLPPGIVDVTRPDARAGRHEAGVRQHRGLLLPEDVQTKAGITVTSATRTAIDITTVAEVEAALVAVNFLLHAGLTTKEAISARYAPMERHPHTLRSDLVFRLADGRIESVAESRTFYMCWRQHIPTPHPQFEITGPDGRLLAVLDFAWPRFKAWLEVDGEIKYRKLLREGETVTDAVLREKRREDRVRELTGWRCIRITWADLQRPRETARRILQFLGA